MAVKTSGAALKIAVHAFVEPGVDFPDNFKRVGMLTAAVLLGLIRVTP
jgi:hypothetical protein